MKTYSLKQKQVSRKWYILDASEAPVGRLATKTARLLIGKDKPDFTPHIDHGDFVVIINSDALRTTGNKDVRKVYYRHSGFPGGLKQRTLAELNNINPELVIRHAVRGMIPENKLRKMRLSRLKIYRGSEHRHQSQSPQAISLAKDKK